MAWISEVRTSVAGSILTAIIIFLWKKGKPAFDFAKVIFDSGDAIEKLNEKIAAQAIDIAIIKSRQRAFLHTASDPAFITDPKGELIYVNPAWLDLTGFRDPKDAYGYGYLKCIPEADQDRMLKQTELLVLHPYPTEMPVRIQPIGTDNIIATRCRTDLVRDNEGVLIETVGRLKIVP